MVRVYREVRSGQIEPADGTKLTYMLKQIFDAIQIEQLETRLEALEQQARLAAKPVSPPAPLKLMPPRTVEGSVESVALKQSDRGHQGDG